MMYFTFIFVYSMIAYGITKIVVSGDIFTWLRDWAAKTSDFLYGLLSCPLCFGTWVGFLLSGLLLLTTNTTPASLVFDLHPVLAVFFDGCFTAAAVWIIHSITE